MENAHSGERKLSTASPLQPRRFNHGVLARAPAGQPDHWSIGHVFSPWSPKKQDSERSQTPNRPNQHCGAGIFGGCDSFLALLIRAISGAGRERTATDAAGSSTPPPSMSWRCTRDPC